MNFGIFALAIMWWWFQNSYFGWNAKPASDAELITDGITFLLVALSMVKP